jgi:hypothetical protein
MAIIVLRPSAVKKCPFFSGVPVHSLFPTAEKGPGPDARAEAQLTSLEALERRAQARREAHLADADEEEQMTERQAPHFVAVAKPHFRVAEGRRVHFEGKLEPVADPDLQVQWLHNGRPVTIGHRFRPIHDFGYVALDILDVIEEDSGVYECVATNEAGTARFSTRLECARKDCATRRPHWNAASASTCCLTSFIVVKSADTNTTINVIARSGIFAK